MRSASSGYAEKRADRVGPDSRCGPVEVARQGTKRDRSDLLHRCAGAGRSRAYQLSRGQAPAASMKPPSSSPGVSRAATREAQARARAKPISPSARSSEAGFRQLGPGARSRLAAHLPQRPELRSRLPSARAGCAVATRSPSPPAPGAPKPAAVSSVPCAVPSLSAAPAARPLSTLHGPVTSPSRQRLRTRRRRGGHGRCIKYEFAGVSLAGRHSRQRERWLYGERC